jgi:hypothetical protein
MANGLVKKANYKFQYELGIDMPVCMVSYMTASYGHVNHVF